MLLLLSYFCLIFSTVLYFNFGGGGNRRATYGTDLRVTIELKDFRYCKDCQQREFFDMNDFYQFYGFMKLHAFVIMLAYFEWLDIFVSQKNIFKFLAWAIGAVFEQYEYG